MDPKSRLGAINVRRRAGSERFHTRGYAFDFDMLGFWQWAYSDLLDNAGRGVLAEYVVGQALGVASTGVREQWAPHDLVSKNGLRIEVKSAAYLQSWDQRQLSSVRFSAAKTRAWDKRSGRYAEQFRRQADVYVFALLAHADKETVDPLDLSQWEFYVISARLLDRHMSDRRSITLSSLQSVAGQGISFEGLKEAIESAGRTHSQLRDSDP